MKDIAINYCDNDDGVYISGGCGQMNVILTS